MPKITKELWFISKSLKALEMYRQLKFLGRSNTYLANALKRHTALMTLHIIGVLNFIKKPQLFMEIGRPNELLEIFTISLPNHYQLKRVYHCISKQQAMIMPKPGPS